jgi:hypothetical protein
VSWLDSNDGRRTCGDRLHRDPQTCVDRDSRSDAGATRQPVDEADLCAIETAVLKAGSAGYRVASGLFMDAIEEHAALRFDAESPPV